ncbi:MAG: DNA-directed RNA polymerase subunit omega [Gudongella sp.]|jgi:DNA-directed RNA polymerase subunit omega|nr:DNA-directed RNA polymerase subunit omega [Gudongella sp.]
MTDKINEFALEEENRYTLVMIAAKRARQIIEGSEPKLESKFNKPVTIALDEITHGLIEYVKPPTIVTNK